MKGLIIACIALLIALAACSQPGYDDLAKCLTEKGVKFYGAFWCPHCSNQKEMFGSGAKYLPYIECSLPDKSGITQTCKDAGIKGFPTWVFPDGTTIPGEVQLERLSALSGCPLSQE